MPLHDTLAEVPARQTEGTLCILGLAIKSVYCGSLKRLSPPSIVDPCSSAVVKRSLGRSHGRTAARVLPASPLLPNDRRPSSEYIPRRPQNLFLTFLLPPSWLLFPLANNFRPRGLPRANKKAETRRDICFYFKSVPFAITFAHHRDIFDDLSCYGWGVGTPWSNNRRRLTLCFFGGEGRSFTGAS